jgi:hypothetical protein
VIVIAVEVARLVAGGPHLLPVAVLENTLHAKMIVVIGTATMTATAVGIETALAALILGWCILCFWTMALY